MTVYKVPEVNILVKVKKKNQYHDNVFFFLFVTFLSKLSGFHATET